MAISYSQALILKRLTLYDKLRLSWHGYLWESIGEKVDGRSLLGLLKRGLLVPAGYDMMPSVGHISSPIFYDTSVTEEGKKELERFEGSMRWDKKQDWERVFGPRGLYN